MQTTIQKWGNSLAVRIPKSFTKEAKLEDGATIDLSIEKGAIVIKPGKKEYSLKELLKKVTEKNIHSEVSTGDPVGREVW